MKVLDWSKMPMGTQVDVWDSGDVVFVEPAYFQYFMKGQSKPVNVCMTSIRKDVEVFEFECASLIEQAEFTYWPGGECPLPDGVMVEVIFRDGGKKTDVAVDKLRWEHFLSAREFTGSDIIAYRILGLAPGWKYPHEVENET